MPILSIFTLFIFTKKSRSILGSLLFFVLTTSCSHDLSQDGRVALHNASNKSSFTFFVSEDYVRTNQDSKPDELNPKMSKAESKLLNSLLKERDFCLNSDGKIFFKITSKQEKIYDMTFAHLIEQNYNARPVTPRMYYGDCVEKPLNKKEAIKQIVDQTKAAIQN